MPRRFRINGPLLAGLLVVGLGFAGYIFRPLLVERVFAAEPGSSFGPSTLETIRERGITVAAGLWFFVFGATIGSFLNVVAYRMPMGLTFVSKPSRCPYCETPIRFKHNVPILGWIALRGRCHACRLPISIRYLLVEVIVGTLCFVLFVSELASGGANLPIELSRARRGIMWNVLSPNWWLIGLYFYHVLLIGILSTVALIKFDRLRIPTNLGWFAVLCAVACRWIWPRLTVVPWWSPSELEVVIPDPWGRVLDAVSGAVVGALVGWAAHHIAESKPEPGSHSSRSGILVVTAIVGAFLGWQVVVPFLFIASLIQFSTMLIGRLLHQPTSRWWAASCLWAAMLVVCCWRLLGHVGLATPESSPGIHYAWLYIALAATYVSSRLSTA